LLGIKPLVDVANSFHLKSRTDGEAANDSRKLVDSLSVISQAAYSMNLFRVSNVVALGDAKNDILYIEYINLPENIAIYFNVLCWL